MIVNDPSLPVSKGASPALAPYLEQDRAAAAQEDLRKLYVAFTLAEDLLIIHGKQLHSLPPEKENEPVEPLHEVCKIVDEKPALGCIAMLDEWPQLLDRWLEFGREPVVETVLQAPPARDLASLETDIRAIAAFIGRELPSGSTSAGSQEIFSLQDLRLFKACPRRFFFTSCHISPFTEKVANFAATLGTMVHETIRFFHAGAGHDIESREAATNFAWEQLSQLVQFYGEEGKQAFAVAKDILRKYVYSELGSTQPWMIEAEVNVKFDSPQGAFFVRGFADRVDRRHGEVSIIDFKTRHYTPEAHESYREQLALYRIAALRGVLGEAGCLNFARSSIAYLTADGVNIVEIEPDLPGFEKDVLATVGAIRNEQLWQPSSGSECCDCGYAVLCHGAVAREETAIQQA